MSLSEEQHTSHGDKRVRSAPEDGGVASNMSLSEEQHTSHGAKRMEGSSSNRRSHSPTPTCVSMKSDDSMWRPINFTGGNSSTGQMEGSSSNRRSHSPTPTCVSMKSDDSMWRPINFTGGDSSTVQMEGSSSNRRSHSPTPTCVSMKSDDSMWRPINFTGGDSLTGQMEGSSSNRRSHSPTPTCVSMKSDDSMWRPINFTGGDSSTGQSDSPVSAKEFMVPPSHIRRRGDFSAGHYQHGLINIQMHQIHKSHMQKKFQHLIEGVPNQGNPRFLQEIYTELHIIEGGRGEIDKEHEVKQLERASWRKEAQDIPINCSDIFEPSRRQHKPIRTVLTKGMAGIGKTVSVQKFILDWSEGKNNQDINFIVPLLFRELNLMIKQNLSLMELIQISSPGIKDPRIFRGKRNKVLFILDGLDECRLPLDFHSNPRCCDVTEPAPVDVLLTNLIKGNLLPSALLWITTRPAATNQVSPECVDRVTEIRGFKDPQKEKYFRKRISDRKLANRTITHLKSSRSLYIMCHIPIFCWITATVVERTSDESEKVEMPRTLTQMYTHFLIIQTSTKKLKYTEREEAHAEMIFKLGKLAFQQLENGNLIFYEEDLRKCDIDVTEASVYSGVCTQIFREETGLNQVKVFSFLHLSIQEFLAALFVFLLFSNRERNMPDQQQTSQLSGLFGAATVHDLHKTVVDLALQSKKGHLDLFLRFLLGLSLESNQNLLRHLLPQTRSQSQSSEQTVQYVKQMIRDQKMSDRRINLFHCLIELRHHAVVEVIDRTSGTLTVEILLPEEGKTEKFHFEISDEFDLQKYIKTPEEDQTEFLSPDDVLQKLAPGVTAALLSDGNLTDKSCAALASGARSTSCSLKHLNLGSNYLIHDAGFKHLSDLLKDPHCKLETLLMDHCSLTEKSCVHLESAVRSTSCSLKELNLSHNILHDVGVYYVSDVIKNPHCKLVKLRLEWCSLTEKSCAALASAARSTSCSLKELDLGSNEINDAGVQHLSDLLKDPHCKLETLLLENCSLTEKSCAALASASRPTSCSLKYLNLSSNRIHDAGFKHLSDLLKYPHCKLETLLLQHCSLTEKSCAALESAVRSTSCSLKELNLSNNILHDVGIYYVSDVIKNPHCKLEKLLLEHCYFTENSCAALASAARSTSCSLKELNLRDNDVLDAGVHFSDLLKNPHCKIEKLVLSDGTLTDKSVVALASAASSTSCSLKELDLSRNRLHDAGVQNLSDLLKNPHCKLETLVLKWCCLSDKSCATLVSAATSTSCSLKEMNLSYNKVHDKGVQHLSDLFKNSHSKLETLEVGSELFHQTLRSPAAAASASSV